MSKWLCGWMFLWVCNTMSPSFCDTWEFITHLELLGLSNANFGGGLRELALGVTAVTEQMGGFLRLSIFPGWNVNPLPMAWHQSVESQRTSISVPGTPSQPFNQSKSSSLFDGRKKNHPAYFLLCPSSQWRKPGTRKGHTTYSAVSCSGSLPSNFVPYTCSLKRTYGQISSG